MGVNSPRLPLKPFVDLRATRLEWGNAQQPIVARRPVLWRNRKPAQIKIRYVVHAPSPRDSTSRKATTTSIWRSGTPIGEYIKYPTGSQTICALWKSRDG